MEVEGCALSGGICTGGWTHYGVLHNPPSRHPQLLHVVMPKVGTAIQAATALAHTTKPSIPPTLLPHPP